jgi:uncharacterized repeat protein (TIGR01451 family)
MHAAVQHMMSGLLALAAAGCLTSSRNSYDLANDGPRDRWLDLGSVRPFDAKAAKIEVSPASTSARVKSEQVLVATVYDREGQPLRNRRVEWVLDGPGSIVEVDESGGLLQRGRRIDSRSAVGYTASSSRRVPRGDDDLSIRSGQTWCVISSPVDGQTTVTAYAPEVTDRDSGRAFVTITWGEADYRFPPSTALRAGGEGVLTTTVARPIDAAGRVISYRVRYHILDGTTAKLVARSGPSAMEAEALTDADGAATVRIIQPDPEPGKTRVAVEVVKPDPSGVGPGSVVARGETLVEWTAPQVSLDVSLPRMIALNRDTPATITLANAGPVDSSVATLRAAIPEGAEFVRADPAPTHRVGRELSWTLGPILSGEKRSVTLVFHPIRRGELVLPIAAETEGGLRADRRVTATVDTAGLKVAADASSAATGGPAIIQVSVTNTGAVPLANPIAWVTAGDGLRHDSGADPVEVAIGPVEPGQTRTVEVPFIAEKSGKAAVRVNVAAEGGLADRADTTVIVTRSELKATVTGPDVVPVGETAVFEIRLTNAGDMPVTNTAVRASLPAGLTAKDATVWELDALNPNETKIIHLTVFGDQPAQRDTLAVTASAEVPDGPRLTARATDAVAVVGTPVLTMEVSAPADPIAVGGRVCYRVTVRNRGTSPAHNVVVSAELTNGLAPNRGVNSDRMPATIDGGRITFPPLAELPPGATATFGIDASGSTPGLARVTFRTAAKELTTPLQEEQAIQILRR